MSAPPKDAGGAVHWWKTDLGEAEIEAMGAAVRARSINPGPIGRRLEARLAERLGVPRVVLANNGSSAVLMALLACEVGHGDEVLIPANGFIATAHAVMLAGGRPRLVRPGLLRDGARRRRPRGRLRPGAPMSRGR